MVDSLDMRTVYVERLCQDAHELIAMGYQQMNAPSFATWDEPAITRVLVNSIRKFMESSDAPDWVVRYSIKEDPPLNVDGKLGKSRPRVDIEFESVEVLGRRPWLLFEAKRLGNTSGHTVETYLGPDGMGRFILGTYPTTHNVAGMLGYVQGSDEARWSDRIKKALITNQQKYYVASPPFHKQKICSLNHTYASHHYYPSCSRVIIIHHVFLRFH